ncbi:hypothetical protein COB21_01775 [Candidatus Aerophobetes bacterium]|uniref:Uncharacterized protein n=1 Tax=Aerophobetes bacterium TaxID=2030807 RepID=A0A2A4X7M7_UNCAE|nr:MAG: hypothetical protein COB21_01775 [Candidatus Aerophobetes bacterium]
MNKSLTKYLLSIFFITLLVCGFLFLSGEGKYQRKRKRCFKELNTVLSEVKSPLDFEILEERARKKVDNLTLFLIKDVIENKLHFEEDEQVKELFENILRIHSTPGGRVWLESTQRQSLLRLHGALSGTRAQESSRSRTF